MKQEVEKKLEELRELRNTYNEKASQIQSEIDNLILTEQNWLQYKEQYIKVIREDEIELDSKTIYYIKVNDLSRLYSSSCRASGTIFTVFNYKEDGNEHYHIQYMYDDEIYINENDSVTIIDENEFRKELEKIKSYMTF